MAPERKHDTDEILDATRALLLQDGPRGATIAAIANRSGAPAGTLYHRFGNREGILAATWLRAVGRFQATALDAAGEADPRERAVGMALAALRFARGNPDDAQLLLALRPRDVLEADAERTLAQMNAPLEEHVRQLSGELYGRADARGVDRVARAIVDVPYSAVRRHAPKLPRWLEEDVERDVRRLLAPGRMTPLRRLHRCMGENPMGGSMRKFAAAAVTAVAFAFAAAPAVAGQPNASCETDPGSNPPPGFSTSGFDHASSVYAGAPGSASAQNAGSANAVSQYDVACVSGRAR